MAENQRHTAHELFELACDSGESELKRPARELFFSGLACGAVMGMSGLGVGVLLSAGAPEPVAFILYPVGFLAVIVGRMQLFTENTVYPVLVVLRTPSRAGALFLLWGVVLMANVLGSLLFALLLTQTHAAKPPVVEEVALLGETLAHQRFATALAGAVVGGWLIATVAWVISSAQGVTGQVLIVFALTYLLGVGHFDHSIAGLGEVLVAVFSGKGSPGEAAAWFCAAVLGNVLGGVGLVSLVHFGQVSGHQSKRTP